MRSPAAPWPGYNCPIGGSDRLVHHGDRSVQFLSIRYTEGLAEAGIKLSVGSIGDSYDNALAQTVIGLFKTEEIYRRGPLEGPGGRRVHEPVEYEQAHH